MMDRDLFSTFGNPHTVRSRPLKTRKNFWIDLKSRESREESVSSEMTDEEMAATAVKANILKCPTSNKYSSVHPLRTCVIHLPQHRKTSYGSRHREVYHHYHYLYHSTRSQYNSFIRHYHQRSHRACLRPSLPRTFCPLESRQSTDHNFSRPSFPPRSCFVLPHCVDVTEISLHEGTNSYRFLPSNYLFAYSNTQVQNMYKRSRFFKYAHSYNGHLYN